MNHQRACVAALAGLPAMTTHRLTSLLNGRAPSEAYAVATGQSTPDPMLAALFARHPDLRRRWIDAAEDRHVDDVGARCDELGVRVVLPPDDDYPQVLVDDPRRPAVLFVQGELSAVDGRRVGIVGTRNPTKRGEQTASTFGHELSAAGVCIVSGLAKGVDGAAHRGALAAAGAPPVAVVANGHDQPYPKRHAALWAEVARCGAVVSEWPPGTPPDAFRFPQRNRILAALSEIVLVVESRERGGSLITAQLAAERGIDVFAIPGPLDARASLGTNQLLRDGAAIAADPDDLLLALGLDRRRAGNVRHDPRPRPVGAAANVLAFCAERPRDVIAVADRFRLEITEAALVLARLERDGWLHDTAGWFEVLESWAGLS